MGKNDDGIPAVSDEDWAQFLAQAEAGAGEAPKEPSARARMVAARLREEDARRGSAEPPAWRAGVARRERGRGGRRLKAALAIAFVAALALIAVRPELVIDKLTGKAEQDAKARVPLAPETARPSAAPSAVDPERPTLREPFKGSPAVQWADGASGIELPEATALNGLSKEQVAAGLELSKRFLVAANLDPATIRGDRPQEALGLIDPAQGELLKRLEQALAKPAKGNDPLQMFVRAGSETKLAGDVVKVRGRLQVQPGDAHGQVDVLADYTFVYPLVQTKPGADEISRSIVRRQMKFTVVNPREWRVTPGTVQLGAYLYDIGNSACFVYDGALHPAFTDDRPESGPTPSGTPEDPYDRSKSLEEEPAEEGCGTLSRS